MAVAFDEYARVTTPMAASPHPVVGLMRIRRLTYADLAPHTHHTPESLRLVLNGHSRATPAVRAELCAFFGLPEDELFLPDDRPVRA